MKRNTDSELIKLVRGEGGPFWPTRHERRLLKFALDTFGGTLSQFLLTGFGEENVPKRWDFTINSTSEDGTLQKRRLQVITHEPLDGSSCLPRGRDPLVFLALLRLLLHRPKQDNHILVFQEEDVLNLLGWEDTDELRHEIDEAIYRYSLLMYKWGMNRSELTRRSLSHYTASAHALSEYRTLDKELGEEGQTKRMYNSVKFDEMFIRGLLGRSLFGVEWKKVKSIKPVTFI